MAGQRTGTGQGSSAAGQRARRRQISRSPRVLAARLFKLFVWLTFASMVAAIAIACSWSRIRVMPIFRIQAFNMVGCPVPGQPEMRRLLAPFVGRSIFDVPAIATNLDAKLKAVPELRNVRFIRHWPNEVELRVKGREPVAVAKTGDTWLSVDSDGVGMRYYRVQPSCLMAVQGLAATMADGKPTVSREQLALTVQVRDAAKHVLKAEPRSITLGDGGAVLVRLNNGDTIRLGQVDQLTAKFQVYSAIRANHNQPVAYVDVSDPAVPAILAAPKPPPPAPRAPTPPPAPPAERLESKAVTPAAKTGHLPTKPASTPKPSAAKPASTPKTSAAKPASTHKPAKSTAKAAPHVAKPTKGAAARPAPRKETKGR